MAYINNALSLVCEALAYIANVIRSIPSASADHRFTRLGEEAALKRLTNEGAISEQTAAKVH